MVFELLLQALSLFLFIMQRVQVALLHLHQALF